MTHYTCINADCRDAMRGLDPCSVDSVVTDPPYGLSFMGKDWDHGVPGEAFWAEAMRVAKPGAHLLAFGGTRTFHRLACAIEDAGWEIRDTLMYVYGSGFPKSLDVSKAIDKAAGAEREVVGTNGNGRPNRVGRMSHSLAQPQTEGGLVTAPATPAARQWAGFGTALKPAFEPIILARKPLDGTVAANVLKWGVGALNVDGCRVPTTDTYAYPNGPGGKSLHYSSDKRSEQVRPNPTENNPLGRWPANFIHDGSDEVVGLLGDAARFFYCAKASKRDRDEGLEGFEAIAGSLTHNSSGRDAGGKLFCQACGKRQGACGCDAPDFSHHNPNTRRNHHPTVKPTDLMRYLCRLVTPPDGVVLDPFMGSGSTGKAAVLEGFRFIGIDLSAEYVEIARARIEHARANAGLFAEAH